MIRIGKNFSRLAINFILFVERALIFNEIHFRLSDSEYGHVNKRERERSSGWSAHLLIWYKPTNGNRWRVELAAVWRSLKITDMNQTLPVRDFVGQYHKAPHAISIHKYNWMLTDRAPRVTATFCSVFDRQYYLWCYERTCLIMQTKYVYFKRSHSHSHGWQAAITILKALDVKAKIYHG